MNCREENDNLMLVCAKSAEFTVVYKKHIYEKKNSETSLLERLTCNL